LKAARLGYFNGFFADPTFKTCASMVREVFMKLAKLAKDQHFHIKA
jgi:hypothetical protein